MTAFKEEKLICENLQLLIVKQYIIHLLNNF